MQLHGKVCLITGGTSGIGAAAAHALARRGASIAAVSRSGDSANLQDLRSSVEASGSAIHFLQADVADPTACQRCVEETVEIFGRLDVLLNSAGGPAPGGLFDVTDADWMNAFATHVHAVFHLARAAAPHIATQGEGSILLVSSAAGIRGCLGALAYGVVKGALPQFTRSLARELADRNIRVNCISPGIIRTPFQDYLTPQQAESNIKNRIPLHREGTPEDVAELIVSLAENDFITGENIVIDGGMSMRIV